MANGSSDNGTNADPKHPFAFAASDVTLISLETSDCYADNAFTTFFSRIGFPPARP